MGGHKGVEHYRFSFRYHSRYFQHAHFIPIVSVGKRGAYLLVHGNLPRQPLFGTTLRFTGLVPADFRQCTPSVRKCKGPDKLGTDPMVYGGFINERDPAAELDS